MLGTIKSQDLFCIVYKYSKKSCDVAVLSFFCYNDEDFVVKDRWTRSALDG
jgi:hypothetical protein